MTGRDEYEVTSKLERRGCAGEEIGVSTSGIRADRRVIVFKQRDARFMGDHTMLNSNWPSRCWWRLRRAPSIAPGTASSSRTKPQDNQQLKEQMRIMMQQMQELQKQVQELKQQQQAQTRAAPRRAVPAPPPARQRRAASDQGPKAPAAARGAEVREIRQGLLRHAGRVPRRCDQGHERLGRLSLFVRDPANPARDTSARPEGQARSGSVGWHRRICRPTSRCSAIAARTRSPAATIDFIYQIETQPAITSSPGPQYVAIPQQSNVVKGAHRLRRHLRRRLEQRLGQAQDRHDVRALQEIHRPHEPVLRDARRLRGHHGQHRRRQPGRVRHPHRPFDLVRVARSSRGMFSFDVLFSPGQNRTYDNVVQSAGSPDCRRRQHARKRQSAARIATTAASATRTAPT